ncbi:MAG TPA: acyltransferase [Candidatus Dormibacteraeota bacterium]|jgi:acetyltransferase-like isoleucine patch superfamily enzyme
MPLKRLAARAAGWLTTIPYRIPGDRIAIGPGLLGNGRLRIKGPGRVVLGADLNAWSHAEPNRLITTAPGAFIRVGRNVRLNGCTLIAADSIVVGDDCVLGSCEIRDHLPDFSLTGRPYSPRRARVVLEDNVWVGGQVSILPGVTVGRNSVIGIHAVVFGAVPANVVVAGNPARVIRILESAPEDNPAE